MEIANIQVTEMLKLNLPKFKPQLQKRDGKLLINCLVRNKFLVLTPEEWVRQHFVNYLLTEKKYALNSIAVEYLLTYNGLQKRADILVFKQGVPDLLVECKGSHIALNDEVIKQISAYQHSLQVPHLCLTNGLEHVWF